MVRVVGRVFVFFSSRRRHTRYWRDWSSDVCSSDLVFIQVGADKALRIRLWMDQRAASARQIFQDRRGQTDLWEIGRASCRERVEISGVAGSFKKKNATSPRDTSHVQHVIITYIVSV